MADAPETMSSMPVTLVADIRNRLGEGCLWHPRLQRLFWLDILGRRLYWYAADGSFCDSINLGVMASAASWVNDDALILAADDGIYLFGIYDHSLELLVPLEADRPGNRSNDGRCDPWGRFWIGTMDRNGAHGQGALYILNGDLRLECVRTGLTIPNSSAFSPDRRRAYLADSAEQTIFAFDLDPESGRILRERVFASTKGEDAVPDGSVVDSEGCLWNAQWDGWRIVRYRPDGHPDRIINLPVSRPTCPAFGGPNLRTLYVTSAREGLLPGDLEEQPEAGGVFALEVDVFGLLEPRFGLTIALSNM